MSTLTLRLSEEQDSNLEKLMILKGIKTKSGMLNQLIQDYPKLIEEIKTLDGINDKLNVEIEEYQQEIESVKNALMCLKDFIEEDN